MLYDYGLFVTNAENGKMSNFIKKKLQKTIQFHILPNHQCPYCPYIISLSLSFLFLFFRLTSVSYVVPFHKIHPLNPQKRYCHLCWLCTNGRMSEKENGWKQKKKCEKNMNLRFQPKIFYCLLFVDNVDTCTTCSTNCTIHERRNRKKTLHIYREWKRRKFFEMEIEQNRTEQRE